MKVYAKFRIDIDKEDESIYTQKVIDLMQKLGCKAEKLYSSMERYAFTVDIEEAIYRELVELQKEIDQVFQYDEDSEEDDDELLDIIEPDIWCSYMPEYTPEEEKNAIGYYIDLAGYEFEENEKKEYESQCPECETFFQTREYIFKKKKQLEDLNRRKAVFTRPGQLDMFATIPMYEYFVEKGISEKNFIPAYYSGILKKVAGYQLRAENVLEKGAFQCESYRTTEACSSCKKVRIQKEPDRGFHNIYLDTEKLGNWGHINATYEYTCGHARRILIYSPEMKEWLTKADEKLIMYPVFPLEMKGKEIIKS